MTKETFLVTVAFIYQDKETGSGREHVEEVIFQSAPTKAVISGIRWAINRRNTMLSFFKGSNDAADRYREVACIKVYGYEICEPDEKGYIKTGIRGIFNYEWKYDTSFYRTVDDLLKANETNPGAR